MKISYIGKFGLLYDEEYIAQSFEMAGHKVQRLSERYLTHQFQGLIEEFKPDIVLFAKLFISEPQKMLDWLKEKKIKTISWTFDLYWDYHREERINRVWGFKADKVFTTDGGHEERWKEVGIDHTCVRQGIFKHECYYEPINDPQGIVFIGSDNPVFPERGEIMKELGREFENFRWLGRFNTNYIRGTDLNKLYAKTKIVVGDSVYSPYYWSNRVVETLGRGGFLIHQDVPGLKEEYPHLITYRKGDLFHLKELINYYLTHEEERQEIMKKNFEWVKKRYTMDKKCKQLLAKL